MRRVLGRGRVGRRGLVRGFKIIKDLDEFLEGREMCVVDDIYPSFFQIFVCGIDISAKNENVAFTNDMIFSHHY